MKAVAIWYIKLPFDITIENNFYNTRLTKFEFSIGDVSILLDKNENDNRISQIKVTTHNEYDSRYLPSYQYKKYLFEFTDLITLKAGIAVQRFFDGVSKFTNNDNPILFDGKDFTVNYRLEINPNIMSGSYSESRESYNLNDDKVSKIISFATRDRTVLDNAWYLLREAESSNDLGKYEISILNMAIMLELLVTATLDKFLNSKGRFKGEHGDNLKKEFDNRPSFADKYFVFGLRLITDVELSADIIESIDLIYKVRDKIAHGKKIYDIKIIKEKAIDETNIKNVMRNLLSKSIDTYNYFYDLNEEMTIFDN